MPATSRILPQNQTIYWDRTGTPPTIAELHIIIDEPVIEPPIIILFAQYQLTFENTTTKWFNAPDMGSSSYLEIIANSAYLQLVFQNLDSLPNGNYKAEVLVELSDAESVVRLVRSVVNLVLTGVAPSQISTDKTAYNLLYNRSNNTLTGDSLVNIINNTGGVLLKFWQHGNVFDVAENFTDSFTLVENPEFPLAGRLINIVGNTTGNGSANIPAKILKQTGEFVTGFTINLVIIDGGMSVQPQSLAYEVFKGTEKAQTLSVVNPLGLAFVVSQVPAWLSLDSLAGNTTKTITAISNTIGLAEGIYSGIIKFEYESKVIDIAVTLDLKTFISLDETIDFCLDLPEVKLSKKNENATLVRMTISAVYEVLGITTTFEKVYLQNYFKDHVLFGLGEKLHRHFPRIKKHFFDNDQVILMQQINATIKVEELDVNRNLLFEQTVAGIRLFPGKKPAGYPFLTNSIFRKKNDKAIILSSTVTGTSITLNKIEEVNLPNPLISGTTYIQFYDFPKVYQPIHLQWENQNLVPEWFTLTGDFTITPEFNHIYARNIFNAQNEKYDVSEIKTLNINTGLIMAKERPLIKEIIRSKLAFIKIGETLYRCFNVSKKMTLQDSKEELLSNDFEFLIVEQ